MTMKSLGIALLIILCNSSFVIAQPLMEVENPLIGKKAPDLTLQTLSGQKIVLSQYQNEGDVILFFWATWCPSCHEELIKLSKSAADIKNKGIKVALIEVGEDRKTVDSYVKRYHLPFDIFLDEESKAAETYNIIGVPTIFLIEKNGVIKSMEHDISKIIR